MINNLFWILWDFFLAVIPVALGQGIAFLLRRAWARQDRRLGLMAVPLLFLWLVFLPNTCYLFTEPRHFVRTVSTRDLWYRSAEDWEALTHLLAEASMGGIYVLAGALTFALSIRPLHRLMASHGVRTWTWALPFFSLMSLGVYLGLIHRFNSWDLLHRPGTILITSLKALQRPHLLGVILVFGVFLWMAYEVVDIWIDGFLGRWAQLRQRKSGEKARPPEEVIREG